QEDSVSDVRPSLLALFGGAAFVMLICCVNVANLLLARATGRRREVAVRCAIGASRGRVLRPLLTESLLLCTLAGTSGIPLAWVALRALVGIEPQSLVQVGEISLNWPVLGFVAAVSLFSAALFGLAPAFETARRDLISSLRESGRVWGSPVRRG